MEIRRILVPLVGQHDPSDPASLDPPALGLAFRAGSQLDAHVEAVCILKPIYDDQHVPYWLPSYGVDKLAELYERDGEVRRVRARSAYDQVLAGQDPRPEERAEPASGFSAEFVEARGGIREVVGAKGRLSDLVVVASSSTTWDAPFRPIIEASLCETARPVLVSPPVAPGTFARKIAITWNDSIEAARAVSASLALMRRADGVVVISCTEDEVKPLDPTPLVEYLAWHGIAAEPVTLSAAPRDSSDKIVGAALAADCDMIVLGGYIHSRAHSLLFGSLTEHMLHRPAVPALIVP